MSLKSHHKVWLDSHEGYDEIWMLTALAAGFDVHHIDEDRNNNDPDNLLMVERRDHMKIHNLRSFLNKNDNPSWSNYANRIGRGESAYKIRSETSQTWMEIAKNMGYKRESQVLNVAKAYALYHKLQWPIPHHQDCKCSWCLK